MGKEILIVDDSNSIREMLSGILTESGFSVFKASNGQEALEVIETIGRPELVISDLNMPVMDGLGLVDELRKNKKYTYLPILILTTETEVQKRMIARDAGATGWIVKPFEKEKLLKTINKVIC